MRETTQAKVNAVNHGNKMANEWYPAMVKALTPFVGCKVQKVDGTLLQKVKELLPSSYHDSLCRYFVSCTRYSIKLDIYCYYENERGHSDTVESTVYVGNLSNGVLTGFTDFEPRWTTFTVEAIKTLRQNAENAQKIADEAKSTIPYEFRD